MSPKAEIRIGTSGFAYKEWKPAFYPVDLPQRRFLEYYATELPAVEIDATFYRMPTAAMLKGWMSATPETFRFALKASRRITHWGRLRVPSEELEYLVGTVETLGDRLGSLLFQLAPNFKADCERLEHFLQCLPRSVPAAFEFRHDSWFSAHVYELLRQHGAALVIHDADESTTPLELTASTTYVRLRRTHYSSEMRGEWLRRFRSWKEQDVDVYAFIKHMDNPNAPLIAREFAREIQGTPGV